jgi:hypothetical protein
MDAAHDFRERCIFQVGQPRARGACWQKQIPEPRRFGERFQALNDRYRKPAVRERSLLLFVDALVGMDVFVHERLQALLQSCRLHGMMKIHRLPLSV